MKKRLIAGFILLTMMFGICSFGVYAAGNDDLEMIVTHETADEEIYHTYTLIGSLPEAAGRHAKMISYIDGTSIFDDSTVKAVDQTKVGKDGTFELSLTLKDEGTYIAEIKFEGLSTVKTKEITIKNKTEYLDIIDLFNNLSNTGSDLAGYVATYANDLGFNTKFFDKLDNKTEVGDKLKGYAGSFTIDNINDIYNKEHIFVYTKYIKTGAELIDLISIYDNLFNIKNQENAGNIYTDFVGMDESVQNSIAVLFASKTYQNFDTARNSFNESVLIGAYNNMTNVDFLKFIKNNNDYLMITELNSIEDLRADTVLNMMHAVPGISSKETFVTEFKKAYQNSTPSQPVYQGGGGGASSPSGSGTSISTDESTKPQGVEIQEPVYSEFTDLNSVPWAREAILELYHKGIVKGKVNGIFAPLDNITREEFAKILVESFDILDETSKCSFTDVSENDWSYQYIASAKKHELIKGYEDGSFGSKLYITRQDMAVMIYRALVTFKLIENLDSVTTQGLFVDEESIAAYAKNSVIMLNNISLIKGNENNEFSPLNNATRAEVAVLISRVLEYIK